MVQYSGMAQRIPAALFWDFRTALPSLAGAVLAHIGIPECALRHS